MYKYDQGDVVNLEFPNQEDPRKSTYHPAIVVEDLEDEVLLVFITSKVQKQKINPKSFVVDNNSPEGQRMGLSYPSLICPKRNVAIKKIRIIPPPRGRCSDIFIEDLLDLVDED